MVGRNHHEIPGGFLFLQVFAHQRQRGNIICRYIEESLDLGGMQVHGDDPVSPGTFQQTGHQTGCDRLSGLGFPVLSGIAEIRNHGIDGPGGRTLGGINGNQQLHEVVIDRVVGGLYEVHILAADRLPQLHQDLTVREMIDRDLARFLTQNLADLIRQLLAGRECKYNCVFHEIS